jgi:hypothetical protein
METARKMGRSPMYREDNRRIGTLYLRNLACRRPIQSRAHHRPHMIIIMIVIFLMNISQATSLYLRIDRFAQRAMPAILPPTESAR